MLKITTLISMFTLITNAAFALEGKPVVTTIKNVEVKNSPSTIVMTVIGGTTDNPQTIPFEFSMPSNDGDSLRNKTLFESCFKLATLSTVNHGQMTIHTSNNNHSNEVVSCSYQSI